MRALIERALAFHTLSIADLVAIFEDARPTAVARRGEALAELDRQSSTRGRIVGVTGTPGSGKSTLIGRVGVALHGRGLSVGVLAVDPSSLASGGSLLGDRVRARFPSDEPRLYFRSQASDAELGGLGPDTFQVCRLLHHLFDVVIVETVGIGQSEVDVRWLCDRMLLVVQPLGGDEVQMLKAGIMEVPDVIVVNKCDERAAARRTLAALSSSLPLSRPFDAGPPPVLLASALSGEGIGAIVEDLVGNARASGMANKEAHFFQRWVRSEWGRVGERLLVDELGGAAAFVRAHAGFDGAQHAFGPAMRTALAGAAPSDA